MSSEIDHLAADLRQEQEISDRDNICLNAAMRGRIRAQQEHSELLRQGPGCSFSVGTRLRLGLADSLRARSFVGRTSVTQRLSVSVEKHPVPKAQNSTGARLHQWHRRGPCGALPASRARSPDSRSPAQPTGRP